MVQLRRLCKCSFPIAHATRIIKKEYWINVYFLKDTLISLELDLRVVIEEFDSIPTERLLIRPSQTDSKTTYKDLK